MFGVDTINIHLTRYIWCGWLLKRRHKKVLTCTYTHTRTRTRTRTHKSGQNRQLLCSSPVITRLEDMHAVHLGNGDTAHLYYYSSPVRKNLWPTGLLLSDPRVAAQLVYWIRPPGGVVFIHSSTGLYKKNTVVSLYSSTQITYTENDGFFGYHRRICMLAIDKGWMRLSRCVWDVSLQEDWFFVTDGSFKNKNIKNNEHKMIGVNVNDMITIKSQEALLVSDENTEREHVFSSH